MIPSQALKGAVRIGHRELATNGAACVHRARELLEEYAPERSLPARIRALNREEPQR
jgi:hypothetical protein